MPVNIHHDLGKNFPRYITKYTPEEFLKPTLEGKLKFGMLGEYRNADDTQELRLHDATEGYEHTEIKRDIINEDVILPGIIMPNATIIGCGIANVHHEATYEAFVFCAVCNGHSKTHHQNFIDEGNASVTSFVVFETESLLKACLEFFSNVLASESLLILDRISYGKKAKDALPVSKMRTQPDVINEAFRRTVFTKAEKFSYENEFRAAIWPGPDAVILDKPIFVSEYRNIFLEQYFSKAVVDSGTLT